MRAFDHTSDRHTIEQVLPEHPGEGGNSFTDEQVNRCVFRVGNLTPLAAGQNRDMGNRPYDEKRAAFAACEFEITRRIAVESKSWTPERIAARQQWLANQATAIWRIAEMG